MVNNQEYNPPSERRYAEKRKRDWESRGNWKDMIGNKECNMEAEENQVYEKVIRDEKTILQAKDRIKKYWRQALWRRLETEQKDKKHWEHMHSEKFTGLLLASGRDALLAKNLKAEDNSIVNQTELREDLYMALNYFYSSKKTLH